MQAIFETVFDAIYLVSVIILGILMIKGSRGRKQYLLFGVMAILLGSGDAFHLVPRAIALNTTGLADYTAALGTGKLITSITMTLFYVLLFYIWRERYLVKDKKELNILVWVLALVRIALCLLPQNMWLSANPPLSWGIYRNIPFTILGVLIVVLFYRSAKEHQDTPFKWLWLTIVLSFAFYLPVVLFTETHPGIGLLMVPKTCAYVWTVLIGYFAMKKETIA